jgi:tetratricopeptide (TPR) repeat protein
MVLGCLAPWLGCVSVPVAETKEQSQRASDIRWFLEKAQQVAANTKDAGLKAWICMRIAQAQAQAGDFAGATATAAGIEDRPLYLMTSASHKGCAKADIAEAQAQAGDFAGAMQTAAGLREVFWKASAYCSIAQAQAKVGSLSASKKTFDLAKRAAGAIEFSWEKAEAFEKIATAQARCGDIAGATSTAARTETDYKKLDAYLQVAVVQAGAGDVAGARRTLAGFGIPPPYDAVFKAPAYKEMAEAEARAGDFAAALQTAERLGEAFWKAEAYCSIAEAQAKLGNTPAWREAIELANQAAAAIEDGEWKAQAYCAIAQVQAKAGEIVGCKGAIELAKQVAAGIEDVIEGDMLRTGRKEWTFAEIAGAQARTGDFAGAMVTAAALNEGSCKARAYGLIAQAQARAGQADSLRAWVQTLKEPRDVVEVCLGAVRGLLGEEK